MLLTHETTANKILSSLSAADFALLAPHLAFVELPVRHQLEMHGRAIEHVYFLENGLASVVVNAGSNHNMEVGIVGNEGVTGFPIILKADRALTETFIQSAGEGWRMGADSLRAAMDKSTSLQDMLLRYVHTLMGQMAFATLASGRFKVEERLARWLLMAADRVGDSDIRLTHEFLALMLGARRASVTVALNELEEAGMIQMARGAIRILDRGALEHLANGCYGAPEAEYKRWFAAAKISQGCL